MWEALSDITGNRTQILQEVASEQNYEDYIIISTSATDKVHQPVKRMKNSKARTG